MRKPTIKDKNSLFNSTIVPGFGNAGPTSHSLSPVKAGKLGTVQNPSAANWNLFGVFNIKL